MIIDNTVNNTVNNTVHEIFNVLEGLRYKDAKAALDRVADELEDNLIFGDPDNEEDNTAEVLDKLSKIQALQKELAALGVKLPACKLVGLSI